MYKALQSNIVPLLIVFAFVLITRNVKGIADAFDNTSEDLEEDDLLDETRATISGEQAKTIAETMYRAMVSTAWGTNEALVYSQLEKLNNQADFNKVYNAFGLRQYSYFWGNQGDPLSSGNRDLIQIMTNEFTQSEQDYIRTTFPNIRVF